MVEIKIDRKTIKRNKDARSTQTTVLGPSENILSVDLDEENRELVLQYLKHDFFLISEEYSGGVLNLKGYLIKVEEVFVSLLKKLVDKKIIRKLQLTSNLNHIHIKHLPIAEYSYSYRLDTLVPCNKCGNKIRFGDIDEYEHGDFYGKSCPVCKAINSFDYKFEKL